MGHVMDQLTHHDWALIGFLLCILVSAVMYGIGRED